MGREVLDDSGRGKRIREKRVERLHGLDPLKITVLAGVIVRPGNCGSAAVVGRAALEVGLGILRLEEMGAPDSVEVAERGTHILMIARSENAAASPPKTGDSGTVCRSQAVAHVQCEKPKLIERRAVERRKYRVVVGF